MQFKYSAVDGRGKRIDGEIAAADRGAAVAELKGKGLIPTSINVMTPKNAARNATQKSGIFEGDIFGGDPHKAQLKPKKLLSILSQMGIMMKAGVSLSLAMEVLIEQESDKLAIKILQEISDGLYAGLSISQSMKKFATFPKTVINIVSAGEANGRLDIAFERASTNLGKQIAMRGKIKSAMNYPAFLMVLTIMLVFIMNVVVLPTFVGLFDSMGAELPGLTVAVMAFSDFLTTKWYYLLAGGIIAWGSLKIALTQSRGFRLQFDRAMLKLPIFGKLIMQSAIAQFCGIMNSLVEAGIEIVSALEIARDVVPNAFIRSKISKIVEDVKVGMSINRSMAATEVFDPLLVSMIRVGEESGALDEVLGKMAALYEDQTDEAVKNMTAMMEPMMTVIIAVVVGTVVISIILPMFGMYDVIA